ncbi:hypothetical protein TNIN_56681 [Trichonephila inaurata madagascariensis]|uniref:Transposase n=1 Tax=Trichonephila inaurata madagascariensis TaxID=2747483 RepID=A0A8X6YX20_9ARAC|nr:hypothetical protein TNIN_56681 [Trichonephila inaurata madagascariensis]
MLGKKKGQKSHIIVDTRGGLVIAAEVHSASIQDRDSAFKSFAQAKCKFPNFTQKSNCKYYCCKSVAATVAPSAAVDPPLTVPHLDLHHILVVLFLQP